MAAWRDRERAGWSGPVLRGPALGTLATRCAGGTCNSFALTRRHAGDVGDAWRRLLLGAPPSVA